MKLPRYEVRAVCGDWALDIDKNVVNEGLSYDTLYFHNRANADLVKDILEWEDAHPNKAGPYPITVTPPNEPLTLEQLREMDGEPVWIVDIGCRKWYGPGWAIVDRENDIVRTAKNWNPVFFERYGESWLAYRRPPEGEKDTNEGGLIWNG